MKSILLSATHVLSAPPEGEM